MKADNELVTIARINRVLDALPPDAKARVLAYLLDRHGHKPAEQGKGRCNAVPVGGTAKSEPSF